VQSVEQWRSENDAMAAAEDEFKLWLEKGARPALRISHIKNEIDHWKKRFSSISCELRSDGLKHEKGLAVPLVAKLPGAFVCLPLSALLLNHRADYLQLANSRAVLDVGKSFRQSQLVQATLCCWL